MKNRLRVHKKSFWKQEAINRSSISSISIENEMDFIGGASNTCPKHIFHSANRSYNPKNLSPELVAQVRQGLFDGASPFYLILLCLRLLQLSTAFTKPRNQTGALKLEVKEGE